MTTTRAAVEQALAALPVEADSPWTNLDKMPYIHKTDDPKASPWNCPVVGRFDYLQTMQYMLACQPANLRQVFTDHDAEKKALEDELVRVRGCLSGAVELARDAHAHWDADRDVKVGKLLLALAGFNGKYDARADAIHAALSPTTTKD